MLKIISLRSRLGVKSIQCLSTSATPSTTTTVLVRNLPLTATQTTLSSTLKDVKCRKVEIEPGCTIHLPNLALAESISSSIGQTLGMQTNISSTSLPVLLLQNLPCSTSVDKIHSSFSNHNIKSVHIVGTNTYQTIVASANDALKASKILETANINGQHVKTSIIKLPNEKYCVQIFNVHESATVSQVQEELTSVVSTALPGSSVLHASDQAATVLMRFATLQESEAAVEMLKQVTIRGSPITVVSNSALKRPVLMIRNIQHTSQKSVLALLDGLGAERVQFTMKSADLLSDIAVAYFASEELAFQALSKLKGSSLDGKTLGVNFREISEPAILIKNLPVNCTDADILSAVSRFGPTGRVERHGEGEGTDRAVVVLESPAMAELAAASLKDILVNDKKVAISSYNVLDSGLELKLSNGVITESDMSELRASLSSLKSQPKSVSMRSNISAFLGFMTVHETMAAHKSFVTGSTKLAAATSSSLVSARMSYQPSFALEVAGLGAEESVNDMTAKLSGVDLTSALKIDRSAMLKFKRHLEVLPGMKQIKSISMDGQPLAVERYRGSGQLVSTGHVSDYDEQGAEEVFDHFSLRRLLKDYMYSDPATRYQIARSAFEQHLQTVQATNNVALFLDSSASADMRAEAKALLSQGKPDTVAMDRLFELFVQRDDMETFAQDFKEMEALLGPADTTDPFDWSQFQINDDEELMKLQQEMQRLDTTGGSVKLPRTSQSASDKSIVITTEEGKEEVVSLEDPDQLIGRDGRAWSGAILNTDMVQKTMPGNRMSSHRALVVVGNMRGAAGMGMGKGKKASEAVTAAFRDALRNLVFVDLYENFGLAHDLHGKHNSCHAYIRATPKSRSMVACPFATAILLRFGIASASVKLVGRRDPYAMSRALFDALRKHENIDEFAKDRGKRYITLQWMYNNQV